MSRITWNTILRIPDPESKTISRDSGVGREVLVPVTNIRQESAENFFLKENAVAQGHRPKFDPFLISTA